MSKKIFTLACTFIFSHFAFAQVTLSPSSIDFDFVVVGTNQSKEIELKNTSDKSILIKSIVSLDPSISTTENNFSIGANGAKTLSLKFSPNQNIDYTSALVLVLENENQIQIPVTAKGKLSNAYYNNTYNKWNEDLKNELKSIISANYTSLGYNTARDKMYGSIDNKGGKVTCVYTGREATFNTRAGATSNNFNTEHTWPQSFFSSREPERSDLFHLFPTDDNANNKRASFPFGIVTGTPSWTEGGSKLANNTFEPRDTHKGAVARSMFYFIIRYGDAGNFWGNQENIYRTWHQAHPPTNEETARNNSIFSFQKNRNPFIDFPGFVDRINDFKNNDVRPITNDIKFVTSKSDFGNISNSDTRTIHLYQNGNQNGVPLDISSKQAVVTKKPTSIDAREVGSIDITFNSLQNGVYTDTIVLKYANKTVYHPMTFIVGNTGVVNHRNTDYWIRYEANSGKIKYSWDNQKSITTTIYNAQGKIILNDITNNLNEIPFTPPSKGIYFVVLSQNNQQRVGKVVIY